MIEEPLEAIEEKTTLAKDSLDDWSKPSRGEKLVLGSKKENYIVPVPGTGNRYFKRSK